MSDHPEPPHELITDPQKFFEAALNTQWQEGQERKIALPHDHPDVVAVYIQWLYDGTIGGDTHGIVRTWATTSKFWAMVHVFGHKVQDHPFANAAMEAWLQFLDRDARTLQELNREDARTRRSPYYIPECISTVYNGTETDSPARQLLVHIWTHRGGSKWLGTQVLEHPKFLLDLARAHMPERSKTRRGLYEKRKQFFYDV